MKIIEEAHKRKAELERELGIINQLLALHDNLDQSVYVDGNLTLTQAYKKGIISVRVANNAAYHEDFGDRKADEIRLCELKPLLADSHAKFLKTPNFGRKSLNELLALMPRLK